MKPWEHQWDENEWAEYFRACDVRIAKMEDKAENEFAVPRDAATIIAEKLKEMKDYNERVPLKEVKENEEDEDYLEQLKGYLKERKEELNNLALEMELPAILESIINEQIVVENQRTPMPESLRDYDFQREVHPNGGTLIRIFKDNKDNKVNRAVGVQLKLKVYEQITPAHKQYAAYYDDGFPRAREPKPRIVVFRFGKWVQDTLNYGEEIKAWRKQLALQLQIEKINEEIDYFEPLDED